MDSVLYVLGIAVTFIVVVGVHEAGHFWVARRAGVFVERFSIGFGKPLVTWYDRHGTEYCLAVIPFGGYVKMRGEDVEAATALGAETKGSFVGASPVARMAIASAGPVVNLGFAVLIYWLLLQMGFPKLAPVIGAVEPDSAAWQAGLREGDRILEVDGSPVLHWQQMQFRLVMRAGDSGTINVTVRQADGTQVHRQLAVDQWLATENGQSPGRRLGIAPPLPKPGKALVHEVVAGSAAEQAGLRAGDEITHVDGESVEGWLEWVEWVRSAPERPLQLSVSRAGQRLTMTLIPERIESPEGDSFGRAGVAARPLVFPDDWPEDAVVEARFGPVDAFGEALWKVGERVWLTLQAMKKMLTGHLALDNLSGPITIARVAGESASYGLESFLEFLAFFSLSLGVLNLLPIPVLDGGHIVMHGYEAVRGRPLPNWVQQMMMRIGLALILLLAVVALYFDVLRVL